MRFFRLPHISKQHLQHETPPQRTIRIFIVIALFLSALYGFWLNNERMVKGVLQNNPSRIDLTYTLTNEQDAILQKYVQQFFREYGTRFILEVHKEPLSLLEKAETSGAVYLALAPEFGEVIFKSPPLVRAALGEHTVLYLQFTHFMPYFHDERWPEGLADALSLLAARLDTVLGKSMSNRRD